MNGEEARALVAGRTTTAELAKLDRYVELLREESEKQNLIARSTIDAVWPRHILDSAQLSWLMPDRGTWIDVGSGAGLPGIVVAIIRSAPMNLIEPRRLRVEFLEKCKVDLGLSNVSIIQGRAEMAKLDQATVISARAVARADSVIRSAAHLAGLSTFWLLPKGKSAQSEVAEAKRSWQGTFHVEQSIVDASSGIIVATKVAKR